MLEAKKKIENTNRKTDAKNTHTYMAEFGVLCFSPQGSPFWEVEVMQSPGYAGIGLDGTSRS